MQPAATQPRRGTLLGLALLVACAYAAFAHGAVRIPDETWLQAGLDVAALLAAAAWLSRREGLQTTREGWLGIALLTAFGAWCAITMLWSVAPDQSWLEANRSLAYALAVMLAVGLGTVSTQAIERIAVGWLVVASATSGAGTPASELRLFEAASTALSAMAGAGFEVGAGCGAGWLPAAGVVPGGTPVVAVGPGLEPDEDGVVVVVAGVVAAACFEHPPAARLEIAASRALGKSGAYCSMSLGTWRLASASCCADHLQASTCPVFL